MAARRAEAAAEFACETYDDYGKMLRGTNADVITVATPSAFHGPQTIAALKAGKHVVVEKPLSTSVREADRMIAAAATCRRHLMIHQNYRISRSFTFMQALVKSGKLGKLTHLAFNSSSYARRNDWQCLRANAGGLLNNHGTHALDQLLTLVRSPIKDVLCDMKHISDAGDVEDQVTILLRAGEFEQALDNAGQILAGKTVSRISMRWYQRGMASLALAERSTDPAVAGHRAGSFVVSALRVSGVRSLWTNLPG